MSKSVVATDYTRMPKAQIIEKLQHLEREVERLSSGVPMFDAEGNFKGYRGTGTDISAEVKAEEMAAGAQERLMAAIESVADGFALFDADDRMVFCNSRFKALNPDLAPKILPSVTFEEMLRDNIAANRILDALGDEEAFIRRRMEQHRNPSGPLVHQRRDGRWLELREERTPEGSTFLVNTDITERKAAEDALRESEAQLRLVADNLPVLIAYVDGERRYRFANKTYEDWTLGSIDEINGQYCWDVLGEQAYEALRPHIDMALSGETAHFEIDMTYPDGKLRKVEATYAPDVSNDGQVKGFFVLVIDITERKRADEVLQLTQFALDHANDMVFWLESSGRFIYVNDTICKLLGYSRDELLSMDITDVDPDATLEEFARSFERLRAHGPYIFEAHYRTKDGKIVPVEVSTRFMKYGDKELVNSLSRDITKRKAADEALHRAKEEAELANRTKSRFFANMSHELRTPLSAIISFSKLIRSEGYGPVGSKKYLEFAADIENSGALLLEVINDILDLSKAEAGRLELREEAVDVARALDTCVRLVLDRALTAEVEVKLEVAPGLPHLRADEHMVIQIVLNLLSNAIKFTPSGGEVRLRAVLDKGGGLELEVADTGIGIAEEDLELVLTPFGQVDGSLSRRHQGTGLGLPLTNTLVELHQGRLEIASELGAGTTVTVRFPAERVICDVSTEELPVT